MRANNSWIAQQFLKFAEGPAPAQTPVADATTQAESGTAAALKKYLANTWVVYIDALACHWNIQGDKFQPLHGVFNDIYSMLFTSIDVISERIRQLGPYVQGSLKGFAADATMSEDVETTDWRSMCLYLKTRLSALVTEAKAMMATLNPTTDEATKNLLIGQISAYEKWIWMLDSFLK